MAAEVNSGQWAMGRKKKKPPAPIRVAGGWFVFTAYCSLPTAHCHHIDASSLAVELDDAVGKREESALVIQQILELIRAEIFGAQNIDKHAGIEIPRTRAHGNSAGGSQAHRGIEATAVAVGRPILWGLTVGGAAGVKSVYAHLAGEMKSAMMLSGVAKAGNITREYVLAGKA